MPVTCVSLAAMPSVANGARKQAWNASTSIPPSGMGLLSRQQADLRQQLLSNLQSFGFGALAVAAAARARQAHAGFLGHHVDERLHAGEIDVHPRERGGIDRHER